MSAGEAVEAVGNEERYQGFSLKSVCWGYRHRFAQAIDELFAAGTIGPDRPTITAKFFEVMRWAEEPGFANVLKDFLSAVNARTRWMMGIPELFADVVDTGRMLAGAKLHYGNTFFEIWGGGGFGDRPEQVRELMALVKRVNARSTRLALALVKGYSWLLERLPSRDVERYVEWAMEIHARNVDTGLRFMEGRLRTSEEYARHIGRACRLQDVRDDLERLLKALAGRRVSVGDLGRLDSDELLERGTRTVCLYQWLYLPASCRHAASTAGNRAWFKLAAVCAAGMLAAPCFPAIHGHRDYRTCKDLSGGDPAGVALFTILEYARGLAYVRANWPGAAGMLERALSTERAGCASPGPLGALLFDVLSGRGDSCAAARELIAAAGRCASPFESADLVRGQWGSDLRRRRPELGASRLPVISFLPDFGYPGETTSPPPDSLILDLRGARERGRAETDEPESPEDAEGRPEVRAGGENQGSGKEESGGTEGGRACYVYDEWSHFDQGYYRDYCLVDESRPKPARPGALPPVFEGMAGRVRRSMELLKPDAPQRERNLAEGDTINDPRLVDFTVRRRVEPSPRVDFYERPRTSRRDVAVLLLLDVSGSTGSSAEGESTIIDCEKAAAVILSDSLATLGDRFAVCGFSGNGRENCQFLVYKDFRDAWDDRSRDGILAARPATGTRMGAALRHGGYRLSKVDARRRVILLETDATPMDSDYNPATGYAQYDVRRAVQENNRRGIATFCICTDPSSCADLWLMFSRHRFVVLRRVEELPLRLAGLYAKMTR